ncbi:MAG: hypothetical protein L0H29_09065, partial [Sinobacteraceae bacterium]|nr:hypothetical protein [Nevskiaceae bacterium]
MYFPFARPLCVLLVLGLSPLSSLAAVPSAPSAATQTQVLTLSQALSKALESNPELATYPATRRIAEAEKLQA